MSSHAHVRTMDLSIINDKFLRTSLASGLNHIIPQSTTLHDALQEICVAWLIFCEHYQVTEQHTQAGIAILPDICYRFWHKGAKVNIGQHRQHQTGALTPTAILKLTFFTKNYLFSGLDKAANNISIICIQHIRAQALHRLQGPDFQQEIWSINEVTNDCHTLLEGLIPEITFWHAGLPFLMASYKLHKLKYRWITNAARCLFSGPTSIITQLLSYISDELKTWARAQQQHLQRFFNIQTSFFWVIDSMFEFTLNLPERVHTLFIADITHCYETIPLTGSDSLPQAIKHVTQIAYNHHNTLHRQAEVIWVHINLASGMADKAKWASRPPGLSCWLKFDVKRCMEFQQWIMTHCFVRLGDQAWR